MEVLGPNRIIATSFKTCLVIVPKENIQYKDYSNWFEPWKWVPVLQEAVSMSLELGAGLLHRLTILELH